MMKGKKKEIGVYIFIIALQMLVILYWAQNKMNYFVDELYSMGYASSFTGEGDIAQYITTSPEWEFNKWIKNENFNKYLVLSEEEKIVNASMKNVVQRLITGRNYFGLLNLAETFFGYTFVSARPGLMLNIIFFLLAEIALISLMKKLKMDEMLRYLSLAMFGFSGYIISAVEYIRFYMLIIMLMLMILNLMHQLWNAEKWKQIIPLEIGIMILVYLAYKNSELTVAFFGAYMISFFVAVFLDKRWKQVYSCMIMGICGIVFIVAKTDYIKILFNPNESFAMQNAAVSVSKNISNTSLHTFKGYFLWLKQLFETHYFGSYWSLFLLVGAITICLIIQFEKTENKKLGPDTKLIRPFTIYALGIWMVILYVSSIFNQGTTISKVVLIFIALLALGESMEYRPCLKKHKISSDTKFVLILVSETIIYTIFEAMAGHSTWRYYSYGFVSAVIIMWYIVDRLFKKMETKCEKRPFVIILTAFVIVVAIIPFKTRNIEYMYEEYSYFLENVDFNRELDVVLVVDIDKEGTISRHETYDCVNLMSENSNIYAVDIAVYEFSKMDYPKEFVLWNHKMRDIEVVLKDLEKNGYKCESLGVDHVSKAYVCRQQ